MVRFHGGHNTLTWVSLKTMFTLNIGLNRPDGGKNTPRAVAATLRAMFPKRSYGPDPVRLSGPHPSESEPTIVATIDEPWADWRRSQIFDLAVILGQEAVAVFEDHTNNVGHLFGPEAAKWGDFNPSLFIMPNGKRLAPVVA